MKIASVLERMKTKNFYIVTCLLVATSGTIWLLNYPSTTFTNIVNQTHKGIKNLPSNIQIQVNHEVTVNPVYLSRLGLDPHSLLSTHPHHTAPHHPHQEDREDQERYARPPKMGDVVVGSSVEGGEGEELENALALIASVAQYSISTTSTTAKTASASSPNTPSSSSSKAMTMTGAAGFFPLVIFDLTASEETHELLRQHCNSSWNCEVRKFQFDKFPSHVADLSIRSYRPLCIQELLTTHWGVVWVDAGWYLQPGANLSAVLRQAGGEGGVGMAAWPIEDPTSAITHPRMFRFFRTRQEQYYFHRAVQTSHLVVTRTASVIEKVMLPWVKCALLEDCINPVGAQPSGCNKLRKPLFKYSGCHYYDMSALNVILGPLFDFDERAYATREPVFGNLEDDRLAAKNSSSGVVGGGVVGGDSFKRLLSGGKVGGGNGGGGGDDGTNESEDM